MACVVRGFLILLLGLGAAAIARAQQADTIFASGFEDSVGAARFLSQATFGPTLSEIARVQRIGYAAWLDEQFAKPPMLHKPFFDELVAGGDFPNHNLRVETWYKRAVQADDQLRQRVAFALSQIFVVSDQNTAVSEQGAAATQYYDLMVANAFGNYRDLLEQVTLHPIMGVYLSALRNQKDDVGANVHPDENFAREVMQLFSIGLVQLGPDGRPLLVSGQPVPTYSPATIRGFARVFTGWIWTGCPSAEYRTCNPWTVDLAPWWLQPMSPNEEFHETGAKQLLDYPGAALSAGVLPAGGDARADLAAALDNIFHHPNVGPFVARRLIQRLTTSNPTPAYVQRVAAAFNDDGTPAHVRGNLRAVVRAILLDEEARDPAHAPAYFGKVREPLLRVTQIWRAFDGHDDGNRFRETDPERFGQQAPLRSPSVFNFFSPDFRPPGELAQAGLVAPELQITTDSYITRFANELDWKLFRKWRGNPDMAPYEHTLHIVMIDLDRELPFAANLPQLIERYNLLFMSGHMSASMKSTLLSYLAGIPASTPRQRVSEALWLILNSPEYVVEK